MESGSLIIEKVATKFYETLKIQIVVYRVRKQV